MGRFKGGLTAITVAGPLLLFSAGARGEAVLDGQVERLTGEGLEAVGVRWQVAFAGAGAAATVQAERATLGGIQIRDLRLHCPALVLNDRLAHCADLTVAALYLDRRAEAHLSLDWQRAENTWRARGSAEVDELADFEGELVWQPQGLAIAADRLAFQLPALAAGLALPQKVAQGELALSGPIQWREAFEADLSMSVEGLSFDSDDGGQAGADLGTRGRLELSSSESGWQVDFQTDQWVGELLLGDLYLSLAEASGLTVSARAELAFDGSVRIPALSIRDDTALDLTASATLAPDGALETLDVSHMWLAFPDAHQRYLASLARARGLGGLTLAGEMSGSVALIGGEPVALDLDLDAVHVDDGQGRFAATGLNGRLRLGQEGTRLSWQGAEFYSIPIQAGRLDLEWLPGRLGLIEPVRIATLGGALALERFELGYSSGHGVDDLVFQGRIEPLSLADLTGALDWPQFPGSIAGEIPRVALRDGVVVVDGDLAIDVFDGHVVVGGLRLERLFGVLPTLAADIDIQDIDLNLLTSAFSFGRIEGRIDGRVTGLRMLDWSPVAFDLVLGTDPDARDRRRISQRAVDNLSSIGGGPAAAVSQTFLSFFDDFGYRRLGLGCELSNNVCRMAGVGPAQGNGYYIVEGSGIPRIDVIGYSRQVDWPQLLRRLEAATRAAPTVE